MSQLEKLKNRFISKPTDFSWAELIKLLNGLGYEEMQLGHTSGSRARFVHDRFEPITLHKPHPKPILKSYQLKQILMTLKERAQL